MLKRIELSRDEYCVRFINEGNDLEHYCDLIDWEIYKVKWEIIHVNKSCEDIEKNVDKLSALIWESVDREERYWDNV